MSAEEDSSICVPGGGSKADSSSAQDDRQHLPRMATDVYSGNLPQKESWAEHGLVGRSQQTAPLISGPLPSQGATPKPAPRLRGEGSGEQPGDDGRLHGSALENLYAYSGEVYVIVYSFFSTQDYGAMTMLVTIEAHTGVHILLRHV